MPHLDLSPGKGSVSHHQLPGRKTPKPVCNPLGSDLVTQVYIVDESPDRVWPAGGFFADGSAL